MVIAVIKMRRQISLRFKFLSPFAFSLMARAPSLNFSLCGLTLTRGVPSARQKAAESSA
jgi:hypothetical protein